MNGRQQRGVSAVMLIAIIVLLAGLGAYAMRFLSTAQGTQSAARLALRAELAARAGLEWQRFRLAVPAPPAALPAGACAAATNLNLPLESGAFRVTVSCQATGTHTEGGGTVTSYSLTATACWPAPGACPHPAPPADYVERQVSAVVVR